MQRLEGMNLTLVAFHGSKPDPLIQLVEILQTALRSELGPAFSVYPMEQVHAKIIGLEGWRAGMDVFNANAAEAVGDSSPMDLHGLFRFFQEMRPLQIRIGGFAASSSYPFTSRGLHPYFRSIGINDSLAVMMGWPVMGESHPMTLDSLRRDCRQYNVIHKYHGKEIDIDNDFFLVLGRVERKSISMEKVDSVQDTLRQILAKRKPLDLLIQPEDLSVVAYTDTQLPAESSVRYSIAEALVRAEELKLLYRVSLT